MSSPVRVTMIRKTLLEAIKEAHGYALEVGVLRGFVDSLMRPPTSYPEWSGALHWSIENGLIVRVASDMDENLEQYAITERGRLQLLTR
jgi:hypothetical protein